MEELQSAFPVLVVSFVYMLFQIVYGRGFDSYILSTVHFGIWISFSIDII